MAEIAAASLAVSAYVDAKFSIGEDLGRAAGLALVKLRLNWNNAKDRNSLFYVFEEQARKNPDGEAYVCDGVTLTWREVELQARKIADFLLKSGVKRGDVVSLLFPNKPAYPIVWIACLSVAIVPAFINSNLTGRALIHCIEAVKSQLILFDSSLADAIAEVAPTLKLVSLVRWVDNFTSDSDKIPAVLGALTLDPELLSTFEATRFGDEHRAGLTWQDPAVLIFTSGTTGLPKAATMGHGRAATAMTIWTHGHSFNKKTRIFTPCPLYHSSAALLAVAVGWRSGATVIIERKFSATKFWDEVRASNANVIQYVGEVLRYLLAVPPSPLDKEHNVRLAYGNGCRPDVWNKFRDRFGVTTIAEFFSASEANTSLFNYNRNSLGAGAVGHEGFIATMVLRNQQTIVRVDPLTEEPARDAKGWCIHAGTNEPGELISHIIDSSPYQSFSGYYGNKESSEKKIMRNVFSKGDAWFRTGDLLSRDADGYIWFADRMGDTFRWRSENVATTDVQNALSAIVSESNVFGVLVPGHDGRAGCAAIAKSAGVDLDKLAHHVRTTLPKYAQPIFVRLVKSHDMNGTVKQLKVLLRNEGVDPSVVKDPVFWLHPLGGKYVPFTQEDWDALGAGKTKL